MNAVVIRSPFHPLGVRPVANDRECAGCVHDKAKAVNGSPGWIRDFQLMIDIDKIFHQGLRYPCSVPRFLRPWYLSLVGSAPPGPTSCGLCCVLFSFTLGRKREIIRLWESPAPYRTGRPPGGRCSPAIRKRLGRARTSCSLILSVKRLSGWT
jgi:hypothetical protein